MSANNLRGNDRLGRQLRFSLGPSQNDFTVSTGFTIHKVPVWRFQKVLFFWFSARQINHNGRLRGYRWIQLDASGTSFFSNQKAVQTLRFFLVMLRILQAPLASWGSVAGWQSPRLPVYDLAAAA